MSRILIGTLRRRPKHCLYCGKAPDTREHAIPEAIGGRLWAYTLCGNHNGQINTAADEILSKTFAPLMTMLQVPRQRGGVGAEFVATDPDGQAVTILPQGYAKQEPLDVQQRDGEGRILRARGDLDYLESLPRGAMSRTGKMLVLATISDPNQRFEVVSDEAITGAVLKIAVHFFAGFVADIAEREARGLLPFILGEHEAGGDYIRTPFLNEALFPDSWPPRHEITCYPHGDNETLITVLLFGAYAYMCRLPLSMGMANGIRYRQALGEKHPELFVDIPIPVLDWHSPRGSATREEFGHAIEGRLLRIYRHRQEVAIRARCECAARRAPSTVEKLRRLF